MIPPVLRIIAVRTLQLSLLALAGHLLWHWPLTGPRALNWAFTPALCVYFLFVFVGPWRWGLPILTHLPGAERVVALTFDDGPSPDVTARILDVLEEWKAPAAFFVLGDAARKRPDLLRRMADEGHGIGLHGDRHVPLVLLNWKAVGREIEGVRAAVQDACPEAQMDYLRPPHGFKTLALPWLARRHGLRLCAWSVNARDYQAGTPEQIAARVLRLARPGAIILLHDGPGCAATADALPLILVGLRERGLACVRLL